MSPSKSVNQVREDLVRTETVSCRLCGSGEYRDLFSADNLRRRTSLYFNLVECGGCGFRYFNPTPTENSLKIYYENYENHVPARLGLLEKIYYRLFRFPKRISSPGKMLDIGCGNGKYLSFMRSYGWEAVGLDRGEGCRFPREELGFEVLDGDLWNQNIPAGSFDLVTLWMVIEHVTDPQKLLNECRRILKPGGKIILSTINSDSFEARFFKRYWWHLLAPEHISQFDPKSLKYLVEKCGFDVFYLRHDPATCGYIGSIQNILDHKKFSIWVNNIFFKILFLPLDIISALFLKSGFITLYAEKSR